MLSPGTCELTGVWFLSARPPLQVWYAHKLVCGRGKACPFRHPKLNDAELEILRDDAFREQLNRVNEYVVLNNILALPFSTVLEHMLGAPEGSLMQVSYQSELTYVNKDVLSC